MYEIDYKVKIYNRKITIQEKNIKKSKINKKVEALLN